MQAQWWSYIVSLQWLSVVVFNIPYNGFLDVWDVSKSTMGIWSKHRKRFQGYDECEDNHMSIARTFSFTLVLVSNIRRANWPFRYITVTIANTFTYTDFTQILTPVNTRKADHNTKIYSPDVSKLTVSTVPQWTVYVPLFVQRSTRITLTLANEKKCDIG